MLTRQGKLFATYLYTKTKLRDDEYVRAPSQRPHMLDGLVRDGVQRREGRFGRYPGLLFCFSSCSLERGLLAFPSTSDSLPVTGVGSSKNRILKITVRAVKGEDQDLKGRPRHLCTIVSQHDEGLLTACSSEPRSLHAYVEVATP